jgi:hypothetical protein
MRRRRGNFKLSIMMILNLSGAQAPPGHWHVTVTVAGNLNRDRRQ